MVYSVKEIFYSLQGEGAMTGRPSLFFRFTGCNLWSGREKDREKAICNFCDTDFIGTNGQNGGKFKTASVAVEAANKVWQCDEQYNTLQKYVVFTGGEPLLQLDDELIQTFKEHNYIIAVETNGTILAPKNIDWICVSPKSITPLKQISGNELKLIYGQKDAHPTLFEHLEFEHFYLQPMDMKNSEMNKTILKETIEHCLKNPKWKLSLQTHKILGID
jgi:7-carboxy-7-deazaguanine synthase (Cx14CxxC type)